MSESIAAIEAHIRNMEIINDSYKRYIMVNGQKVYLSKRLANMRVKLFQAKRRGQRAQQFPTPAVLGPSMHE